MLKRLYINNFKTFVNFEIKFDSFNLLLGPNGVGKTALFEVLTRLKQFVCESKRLEETFPIKYKSLMVADDQNILSIEIDIESDQGQYYYYNLDIEYQPDTKQQRVHKETLKLEETLLFSASTGEAQLYRDDGSEGPHFPMDWGLSGVGFLMINKDNKKLTKFKELVTKLGVYKITPETLSEQSQAEASSLDSYISNFPDWLRYSMTSQLSGVYAAIQELQQIIPSFESLKLKEAGEGRLLYASFRIENSKIIDIPFKQLSDGQRKLITLYLIANIQLEQYAATLCFDEPENHLALPEIQPWLDKLYEASQQTNNQIIIISHHPRVINFLSEDAGIWIERKNKNGPSRAIKISKQQLVGLSLDEIIERGWISE